MPMFMVRPGPSRNQFPVVFRSCPGEKSRKEDKGGGRRGKEEEGGGRRGKEEKGGGRRGKDEKG